MGVGLAPERWQHIQELYRTPRRKAWVANLRRQYEHIPGETE